MILRVGLTGGIASGKSTVLQTFGGLGCLVIDADAVVRNLYRQGEPGYTAIVNRYGSEVLTASGEIDRGRLSVTAFATAEGVSELNSLIHPLVIAREETMFNDEEERFPQRDRIAIVEATLLLESGGGDRYHRIVVVDLAPELQIARAAGRGMQPSEVRGRMAHQMDREERLSHADYVIDNSGDSRKTEAEVRRVYELLLHDLEVLKREGTLSLTN
ncbi:MAG: dephospho-CoA kinase [Acidobacteriota bacterium]